MQAGRRTGPNEDLMRILIAEDDSTSRLVLSRTLEKLGYETLSAVDGADAWAIFQETQPSVVITDWMMPKMDGLDLCRRIRSNPRYDHYSYLIVLTALGGRQNYLEAMNAGTDDFMNKPFDTDQLVSRLRVAERILSMEAELRFLGGLQGCCTGCSRMRLADGQWRDLAALAHAAASAPLAPPRCPDCVRKQTTHARAVPAAAVSTPK
jgi:DNA-binding response OmpR family regulator